MQLWGFGCSSSGRAQRAALQHLRQGARRVPRGVWAPLQAALLTMLLLAAVLPLYFSTIRRTRQQANDLKVLCGLYPDQDWIRANNSSTPELPKYRKLPPPPPPPTQLHSPTAPPAAQRPPVEPIEASGDYVLVDVPAPPAPPGAQPLVDHEQCFRQFESYFDYEGSSDYSNYQNPSAPWGRAAYTKFTITIQDVDPEALTATARITMTTSGALRTSSNKLLIPGGYILNIAFNNAPADEYRQGDVFGANTIKVLDDIPVIPENDLSYYPFDRYNFKITVRMFYNDTNNGTTIYAPFIAGMRTRSPAFSFSVPVGDSVSGSGVTPQESDFAYKIHVARNLTTKVFSIFVFIVMWALTVFFVVHAVWVIAFRHDPHIPYDVPAYSATLLFALPAVRAVQPGVPDVGAVIDIVGFFWNMALLALTSCWLLAAIYVRGRARRRRGHQEHEQEHGDDQQQGHGEEGQQHSIVHIRAEASEPEGAYA